jgi:2-oxoglutarate ferredoxin oxidoreductase subunit delta
MIGGGGRLRGCAGGAEDECGEHWNNPHVSLEASGCGKVPRAVALSVQPHHPSPIWRVFVAKGFVAITAERCKGCGFCVEFCPTRVLALSSAFNSKGYHPPHIVSAEKCSGCDLCGMYCPDFAIFGGRYAR